MLPANAEEAMLAAQVVAAGAQALDCLRLMRRHEADMATGFKCTAQAASMMRQANAARSLLMRLQVAREKREVHHQRCDAAASIEHCAIGLMSDALQPMPAATSGDTAPDPGAAPIPSGSFGRTAGSAPATAVPDGTPVKDGAHVPERTPVPDGSPATQIARGPAPPARDQPLAPRRAESAARFSPQDNAAARQAGPASATAPVPAATLRAPLGRQAATTHHPASEAVCEPATHQTSEDPMRCEDERTTSCQISRPARWAGPVRRPADQSKQGPPDPGRGLTAVPGLRNLAAVG